MRATAFAPLAVALAVTAVPAHADGGPVASLVKSTVNQAVPPPAADLKSPKLEMPVATPDKDFSAERGVASVRRRGDGSQEALARLGKGLVDTAGMDMPFAGISTRCVSDADGTVRALTQVTGARLVGKALPNAPRIPVSPPANFGVPTGDPDMVVTLN
jgi:hypothetical protein